MSSFIVVAMHGSGIPGPNIIGSVPTPGEEQVSSERKTIDEVVAGLDLGGTRVLTESVPSTVIDQNNFASHFVEVKGSESSKVTAVVQALRNEGYDVL